jgi:hypothetical protein
MSKETFDFLLNKVSLRLQKQATNYGQPILSALRDWLLQYCQALF